MQDKPEENPNTIQPETVDSMDVNPDQTMSAEEVEPTLSEDDHNLQIIAELTNDLQRTRADFENYRKQTDLQKTQSNATARQLTVQKLLPLIDDFSRAITTYPDQLKPLAKSLDKTLKTLGLQVIDSAPGTNFNPDFHEAISIDDSEGETEVILETLRPGYFYEDAVIRPAMVKVTHAK